MRFLFPALLLLAAACGAVLAAPGTPMSEIQLQNAVVVTPTQLSGPEQKAVELLVDEVSKRTQSRWAVTHAWPTEPVPVIAVGPASALPRFAGKYAAELQQDPGAPGREGYRIRVKGEGDAPTVLVVGNDARGVLFGVGRLLRELRLGRRDARLPAAFSVATAPKTPLRGHQLGYRPKTNSYDGWDLRQWEQYIRDLAVFGCNAIELIPPRSDDDADSPHFPLPPMEMMVGMSRLADAYGLDVWIWYPAMDDDYTQPATVDAALKEWGEVFRQLPRVDAVFVPGGDPGHTPPGPLLKLLERQTENLHRYHPKAQMWVSAQSFNAEGLDELVSLLKAEPAWLGGVVSGPQVRVSQARLRDLVPARYPIRNYPDITHSLRCQFPVPEWDMAYALTEARECINPRPLGEARIFRAYHPYSNGFITYSEGCNDDVNKAVWSALGWDPDADVTEALRQYSRYYIGDRYTDSFAQGLLALERNWQGPLLGNDSVNTTLQQFQALERAAAPHDRQNWRFQQALYRAYYDAYTRARLLYETRLEDEAMEALRRAPEAGSLPALDSAERALAQAGPGRVAADWRARIFELAEALFQSIHMQLSVERYAAIDVGRGANLDTLDVPLNDAPWLRRRFAEIRALPAEAERQEAIVGILHWTDPGPGGFYDDLGNLARQPHLVRGPGLERDPQLLESVLLSACPPREARRSAYRFAETLFETPLRMHYDGLDPTAEYRVRVLYGGDAPRARMRLVANGDHELHPLIAKPAPVIPLEFDLPPALTRGGTLDLAWTGEPGRGGNGRGCQVSEVWLIRK
jgi:hypothetical protein